MRVLKKVYKWFKKRKVTFLMIFVAIIVAFIGTLFLKQVGEMEVINKVIFTPFQVSDTPKKFSLEIKTTGVSHFHSIGRVFAYFQSPYAVSFDTLNVKMSLDNETWVDVPLYSTEQEKHSAYSDLGLIRLDELIITVYGEYYLPPQNITHPPNVTLEDISNSFHGNIIIKSELSPRDRVVEILVSITLFGASLKVLDLLFLKKNIQTTSNKSDGESKMSSNSSEYNTELSEPKRELLLIEYNELHNEIQQRNQYGWFIISIFVTASFLISFGGESSDLSLIKYGVSFGLIGFSWFLHIYFDNVNASCWNRRKEIQDDLKMKEPEKRHEELEKSWIYRLGAHYLWKVLWISLLLIYGALFIIQLSNMIVLA